ncbi:uncharacterized protein [Haliotis cracherodii]|uniref:uncharacterized protein n=1 Tax=Haliotis cracherodii TaxID=6455 RepID=UPI0039EA00A1
MGKRRHYERIDGGASGKVIYNVYSVLCFLLSIGMTIPGVVYFNDCAGSYILNVYLIVQGALLIIFPILMCTALCCGPRMRDVYYYTVCVTAGLLCTGWLIAGSHWHDVSECKSTTLYKVSLGALVATWLVNGVFLVLALVCRICCK